MNSARPSLGKEAQRSDVYFVRVRPRDRVRTILHDRLTRSFDELRDAQFRSRDGRMRSASPLNQKREHVDASKVLAEVFMPAFCVHNSIKLHIRNGLVRISAGWSESC